MRTLEFRAMNTSVLLAAEDQDQAEAGLQEAREFIERSEKHFSRFLPDSELSRLNRSTGKWVEVSDDLLNLIEQSLHYYEQTNGLFDPSVLRDLKLLGYDRSMDEVRIRPANENLLEAASPRIPRPALPQIEIDHPLRRVLLPPGMEIDLGGIAKGWIVEKAAEILTGYATACAVSAGGDIFFVGNPILGTVWRVEVEDPRDPIQTAAILHVPPGAVATSSSTKRVWEQSGKSRHHLIDPRTREPAESNWLSVTVVASGLTLAEVYAKTFLIGGERFAHDHPEITYLAVDIKGQFAGSSNIKEYLNDFSPIVFQ